MLAVATEARRATRATQGRRDLWRSMANTLATRRPGMTLLDG